MNCQEVRESLWLYKTNETDLALSEKIKDHLLGCPHCTKELDLLQNVIKNLPVTPKFSGDYWESYTSKILNRLKSPQPEPQVYLWRWAPAIAMSLILITGVWMIHVQQKKEIEKIITNLDFLENLEILERDDFDKLIQG